MSSHRCHARGCTEVVAHEMLMCLRHWRMVPGEIQRAVWHAFRTFGALTPPWLEAVRQAQVAVAQKEAAATARARARKGP